MIHHLKRSRSACTVACLALVVVAVSPAHAQNQDTSGRAAAATGSEYRIGVGDTLQLFVWKEPEMSRELNVRMDGRVSIPLLGDIEAAGATPQRLSADVARMLGRFLTAPQVTVGVLRANSYRFFVLGQVNRPGDFPLSGRMTLLQGLALAGGFKEFAKMDSIVVVRQERVGGADREVSDVIIPVNYKKLEAGRDLAQNIVLKPGDTILIP